MDMTLFVIVFGLFASTLISYYAFLRSSFALVELVQKDKQLWKLLGEPRKVWVECVGDSGGDFAIRPFKPWFHWLWSGSPHGTGPGLSKQWRITSLLLKVMCLLLFATMIAIAWLVIICLA